MHQKMSIIFKKEVVPSFMDWKNQYSQNVLRAHNDLQFNTAPVKIPMTCFHRAKKNKQKRRFCFTWKQERPLIDKITLNTMRKAKDKEILQNHDHQNMKLLQKEHNETEMNLSLSNGL